jgi:serine/threonine-protein kinase
MGEVYLAYDTRLKRPVALKRMAARFRDDSHYRRRFLKEAQRGSQLSDPHIAAVYDVLEERGEIFLVMEYVEGLTLRQLLDGPLSVERFLEIAQQCAEAMTAAHSKNIIHCDIKPENIVITPSGHVKMLDFGLAKYTPPNNDATNMANMDPSVVTVHGGTLGYMAPEVLMAYEADARSDIFSRGVVFYEAISGHHPFRSSSRTTTADRILREAPIPLIRCNPQIPAELAVIVQRCLEKNPNDRYQLSRDLVADFRLLRNRGESRAASPY